MVKHESNAENLFRYFEEMYGCGNLASHVAHGAIMALDEHVVSPRLLVLVTIMVHQRLLHTNTISLMLLTI